MTIVKDYYAIYDEATRRLLRECYATEENAAAQCVYGEDIIPRGDYRFDRKKTVYISEEDANG